MTNVPEPGEPGNPGEPGKRGAGGAHGGSGGSGGRGGSGGVATDIGLRYSHLGRITLVLLTLVLLLVFMVAAGLYLLTIPTTCPRFR